MSSAGETINSGRLEMDRRRATLPYSDVPVIVAGITTAIAVGVGAEEGCALLSNPCRSSVGRIILMASSGMGPRPALRLQLRFRVSVV